jgi:hypothetical protein
MEATPVFKTSLHSVRVVAIVTVLAAFALPAGAASKTTSFCRDVEGIAVVLSPALPSSDSPAAIASAVSQLPGDVTALKKIHAKLIAAVASAPSSTLANGYRVAASSVLKERTALTDVLSEEAAVFANPKSSSDVMALARNLIAAIGAAATANAYLTVDHPLVSQSCKS